MYILGINNAYHESSACLVKDGHIIVFAEEERLNRIKHGKPANVDNPDELPEKSIKECLQTAGIKGQDIQHVGLSFIPENRLKKNLAIKEKVRKNDYGSKAGETLFYNKLQTVPSKIKRLINPEVQVHCLSHHLCHAASSYYTSPFKETALLVIDGIAEYDSTFLGQAMGAKVETFKTISYPNSVGFLWEKIAEFLGFTKYDAGKIMALSAYGNDHYYREHIKSLVKVTKGSFKVNPALAQFRSDDFSGLEKVFNVKKRESHEVLGEKHAHIVASLQDVTDQIYLTLTNYLHERTKLTKLCISGGVALNCVANSYLLENGKFKEIYIPPHCNDAGTSIGAAMLVSQQQKQQSYHPKMFLPYWRESETDEQRGVDLKKELKECPYKYSKPKDIHSKIAELLSQDEIIGYFHGTSEIGPRALGHRSILASVSDHRMKEIINFRVKDREFFRPIAPLILKEHLTKYFKKPKNQTVSLNYMLFALKVKKGKENEIPSVVHIDGTSRLQTVDKRMDPNLHGLLSKYYQITGIPMLINTSFNKQEPIVHTPKEALETFSKISVMKYLVIDDYLIEKKERDSIY